MKLALFGLLCLPGALAMTPPRADLEDWEVRSDLTPPLHLEMLLLSYAIKNLLKVHKGQSMGICYLYGIWVASMYRKRGYYKALLCHKETAPGTQSPLLVVFLAFRCSFMA